MFKSRSQRIFFWAIALSLITHLLFAVYFHYSLATPGYEEPRVAHIQLMRIATAPPATPRPTPPRAPRVQPSLVPPRITSNSGKTAARVIVAPSAPPTPVPTAATPKPTPNKSTPTPAANLCNSGAKNGDPGVTQTPGPPDIPPEARASKVSGTALIKVSLDASGKVESTAVAQSSGNEGLDRVAQQMATQSMYTPKVENCKGVAADYMFSVTFRGI